MAFSFTLLAAVASVKDVCYDLAFDFLQEAIVTKGFFPVFLQMSFHPACTWESMNASWSIMSQVGPMLGPWAGHLFRRD